MKLLLTAMVLASVTTAANAAGTACGADAMVTMRVSKLGAAGTPAGFLDAVKDHKAWYASHGFKDDSFVTAPVLVPAKGGMKPSASEYVTFHVYGDKEPKHDAAWDAYVAKYKANATIDSETRFCLPKGTSIAAK
jgi:hypothetical protein